MKINLIATFSYGTTSLEYFYKCALEELGHNVITREKLPYEFDADMNLVVGLRTFPLRFDEYPGKKILIYPDNIGRLSHHRKVLYKESDADLFDRIYLCNKDPEVDGERFHWLPFGYDRYEHPYLGRLQRNVPCIFVGTRHDTRKWMLELPDTDFRIYGNGWELKSNTRPAVYGEQKRDVYTRCYTALNHHYNRFGPNMRFFEILAMGRLMFCDNIIGARELGFKPGKHYIEYTDMNDLIRKVEYYVMNDCERRKIAKAGHKQVLKGHSYTHRMKKMIKEVI